MTSIGSPCFNLIYFFIFFCENRFTVASYFSFLIPNILRYKMKNFKCVIEIQNQLNFYLKIMLFCLLYYFFLLYLFNNSFVVLLNFFVELYLCWTSIKSGRKYEHMEFFLDFRIITIFIIWVKITIVYVVFWYPSIHIKY